MFTTSFQAYDTRSGGAVKKNLKKSLDTDGDLPILLATMKAKKIHGVLIRRDRRGNAYDDVVDFIQHIKSEFGSAGNAAAVLLRRTPEYAEWRRRNSRAGKRRSR